jgi:hypothetical protein
MPTQGILRSPTRGDFGVSYNEPTRRYSIHYGLDGEEPVHEFCLRANPVCS